MTSKEMSGSGAANMIIEALMYSLNMTRVEIRQKLRHVTYDGVYALTEERVHGGGSLNLTLHLESQLQLNRGDISGTWDSGHKMQLAHGDVLLKDKSYSDCVKSIYNLMATFKDKKGCMFKEKADALNHPILTNKLTPQNTRWVRSDLRAFQSFFRNAPTMYVMFGDEISQHASDGKNDKQKQVQIKQRSLVDAKQWINLIGFV